MESNYLRLTVEAQCLHKMAVWIIWGGRAMYYYYCNELKYRLRLVILCSFYC